MAKGEGCQVHAGVLDEQCKLTPRAKELFIQETKDLLTYGSKNLPTPPLFPCCKPIEPNPHAHLLDLENEEKFPDFHKNILGSFEKIACALNFPSNTSLLPICCPVSLGAKLGVDIDIGDFPGGFIPFLIPNPPALAVKLEIMPPPKLIAKFPSLIGVPPLPPPFEIPPKIKVPDFNTLFDFSLAFATGIPKFLLELIGKIPELALKLPNLPELFKTLCDIACESKLFGDIKPTSTTQIASVVVLSRRVVEMSFISAVGVTLGSSGGGIVGGLGEYLTYKKRDRKEVKQSPREKIVQYANDCVGLSWGNKDTRDQYAQRLLYTEWGSGEPSASDPRVLGKERTLSDGGLSQRSTCGMLARACLFAGGASFIWDYPVDYPSPKVNTPATEKAGVDLYYDFYKDRYRNRSAIAGIEKSAIAKNAVIKGLYSTRNDFPPMKKGDIIILGNPQDNSMDHVMVVAEDYQPGSFHLVTIDGGQADLLNPSSDGKTFFPTMISKIIHNKRKPTAAEIQEQKDSKNAVQYRQLQLRLVTQSDQEIVFATGSTTRTVKYVLDGEKICTDLTGADVRKPYGVLDMTGRASDENLIPPDSAVPAGES